MTDCEYCKCDKLMSTKYDDNEVRIHGDHLDIANEGLGGSYIKINYCPMCGRKLGGNDD